MKKKITAMILFVTMLLLTACGDAVSFENGELSQSTIALSKDGTCKMGIVEDFSKDYYEMEELEEYIDTTVSEFQKQHGEESVTLDYTKKDKDKVHVTLDFKTVEDYAAFNGAEVKLLTWTEAKAAGVLPDKLTAADKSGEKALSEIDGEECLVAVWNGNYQIMVEGSVKYYSNSVLLNDSSVQIGAQGDAVIVFQ